MTDQTSIRTDERGDAMQARSGAAYYPTDPRPEDVRLGDVLWALSRMPRFGGHATRTYTVLEHEIRGCDIALATVGLAVCPDVDPDSCSLRWTTGSHKGGKVFLDVASFSRSSSPLRETCDTALTFLCHDAAEAYIADITRPLKVNLPDYVAAERRNDAAVRAALLPRRLREWDPQLARNVKYLDNQMLSAERVSLMPPESADGYKWGDLPTPPDVNFDAPVWSDSDSESCLDEVCAVRERVDALFGLGLRPYLPSRTSEEDYHRKRALEDILRAAAALDAALLCAAWLRRYRVLWTLCADPAEPCPAIEGKEAT